MSSRAVVLLANEAATSGWKSWNGGRASLVIFGTLATTTKLQLLGKDGSTAVDIATISAVGKTDYDLPAGQYRISLSGGSPAAIYADLVSISYT
ncbi:MAG: hypothetical protein KDA17_00530 [Candidatus Saccharibacteria bacterium]|nr:hypothetical protein [Candidatus Saccharibacteria bacterium]